ncbi:hypothetical protein WG66_008604 [Moniliophthora roreri]|nr:hypothetical protein WG66_008605 [Moniliophthora roreri]KAI3604584.1 hypothetical protein WG66_008604 [Moniliophthora roreri]
MYFSQIDPERTKITIQLHLVGKNIWAIRSHLTLVLNLSCTHNPDGFHNSSSLNSDALPDLVHQVYRRTH